jgi:hypothetical protein
MTGREQPQDRRSRNRKQGSISSGNHVSLPDNSR